MKKRTFNQAIAEVKHLSEKYNIKIKLCKNMEFHASGQKKINYTLSVDAGAKAYPIRCKTLAEVFVALDALFPILVQRHTELIVILDRLKELKKASEDETRVIKKERDMEIRRLKDVIDGFRTRVNNNTLVPSLRVLEHKLTGTPKLDEVGEFCKILLAAGEKGLVTIKPGDVALLLVGMHRRNITDIAHVAGLIRNGYLNYLQYALLLQAEGFLRGV